MSLRAAARFATLLWPVLEIVLILWTRRNRRGARIEDRGSALLLWVVITASVTAGLLVQRVPGSRIGPGAGWVVGSGIVLLLAGLVLRAGAVITLGRFFNTSVTIRHDHEVVRRGPYRFVRHPSYTGLLMAFLGLSLFLDDWLSIPLIVIPITAALLYRIRVEEASLRETLGEEYAAYCRETKRLVPGVY